MEYSKLEALKNEIIGTHHEKMALEDVREIVKRFATEPKDDNIDHIDEIRELF